MNSKRSRGQPANLAEVGKSLALLGDEHSIEEVLKRRCPWLLRQIQYDATQPAALRLWGQSLNFDENSDARIVAEPILQQLCRLIGVDYSDPVCHAGVLHTYGYLLSMLKTPFGLKRDRWEKGQIESLAGLPEQTLCSSPLEGTLLLNATYFLGRVAFRGKRSELATLRRLRSSVSPALTIYPYDALRWIRITETVKLPRNRSLRIHTDLVPSHIPEDKYQLLIYSMARQSDKATAMQRSLITAFPITVDATQELLDPAQRGSKVEIRARYNAHIPELRGLPATGDRQAYACSTARIRKISG